MAFAAASASARMASKRQGNFTEPYTTGRPAPDPANPMEYDFVRSVAPQFEAYGEIEHCALVCVTDASMVGPPAYALSEIATQNSRIGCDTGGLSCPAGMSAVADIHNHPPRGSYNASHADRRIDAYVQRRYLIRNPASFSRADVSTAIQSGLNAWLVPVGEPELLYYPGNYDRARHLSYPR